MRRGVPEWHLPGLSCDEGDDVGLPQRSGGRRERRGQVQRLAAELGVGGGASKPPPFRNRRVGHPLAVI
jgi:hypothetical protein